MTNVHVSSVSSGDTFMSDTEKKRNGCFKLAHLSLVTMQPTACLHVYREQRPPMVGSRPDKCRVESGKASGIELRKLNVQMAS